MYLEELEKILSVHLIRNSTSTVIFQCVQFRVRVTKTGQLHGSLSSGVQLRTVWNLPFPWRHHSPIAELHRLLSSRDVAPILGVFNELLYGYTSVL